MNMNYLILPLNRKRSKGKANKKTRKTEMFRLMQLRKEEMFNTLAVLFAHVTPEQLIDSLDELTEIALESPKAEFSNGLDRLLGNLSILRFSMLNMSKTLEIDAKEGIEV
jgi:hypothetical protein